MLTRAFVSLALLAALPAWSQVMPSATGGTPADESQMQTPPSVSGEPFPTGTGSETRSNYLDAGLSLDTSYYDNQLPGEGDHPISDMGYSVNTRVGLDKATYRLHQRWIYDPYFTFYQHTSDLNLVDQNASLILLYRLSQHLSISGRDGFMKGSNLFNQPSLGESVSGSIPSSPAGVFAPYEDRISNQANAQLSYQFSTNSMIGGGGSIGLDEYPNQPQSSGLANSSMRGGSVFYNRLLPSGQYTGVTYQYFRNVSSLSNSQSETNVDTFNFFYTIYALHNTLTLNATGGPQRFEVTWSPLPPFTSWTTALGGSIAWQRDRTNLTASYSRSVAGGGGLLGAFSTTTAGGSAHWQLARTWNLQSMANYSILKQASQFSLSPYKGGHTVSGTVQIAHPLGERFNVSLQYQRLHESYGYISIISSDPDSDRGTISISYQLERPLGR